MEWWTDLWLNEGFATYVSVIGTQHLNPEWHTVSKKIKRCKLSLTQKYFVISCSVVSLETRDVTCLLTICDHVFETQKWVYQLG